MTGSTDWARLDALLDEALARPRAERRAFLDQACGGDPQTRGRLEQLLDIAESEDPLLRPGGALEGELADELLDELAAGEAVLAPGARLGRFEIVELLGRGGAGQVYRARDPTLGRDIAIKALTGALRADPQALGRLEREARVLATVSHPNVAAIHGLETIDGQPYLLLELVPGETLEERLRRGPFPWRAAAALCVQMAEALEEMHRKGIVHRDFKPGNVKLTAGGRVKVLDFGLARDTRAIAAAGEDLATATAPGTVAGTAPYMSPEQAGGQAADARSDLWALGCVLYEMLCGRRAFAGRTIADVLAAVVRDDPDWSALPPDVPEALRRLVQRCLRRDVRQRTQDAGDARIELADLLAAAPPAPVRDRTATPWRIMPWLLVGAALAAAASALFVARAPSAPPARRPLVVTIELPSGLQLPEDYAAFFALSPDASTFAFLARGTDGQDRLYIRSLDGLDAREVAGSEGAWQPFFSPDGRWVAFFAARKLQKVAVAGGAPVPIVEVGSNPRGATWAADGTIVLAASQSSGLSRVGAEGGSLAELTHPDASRGERSHRWPHALPDGSAVLFTADQEGSTFDEAAIEAVSLATRERKVIWKGGAHPRTLPDGRLVFTQGGRLFAIRFDARRLTTTGRPVSVLEGVRYEGQNGGTLMALAADGTLVYVPGLTASQERHITWVDRHGRRERLGGAPRFFHDVRLDARGDRVAVQVGPPVSGEVFVQDVSRATLSQLTFGLRPRRPVWSRDGRRIVVGAPVADGWQLVSIPVPAGPPSVLHESPHRLYPGDHSPDGRFLVFQELDPTRGWDLRLLELDAAGRSAGSVQDLASTPAHEGNARFSPDGRWVAYESDEADGVFDVYVAPVGHAAARQRVSNNSGRWPVWGGPGELLYSIGLPASVRQVSWREQEGVFVVRADHPLAPVSPLVARAGSSLSSLILGVDAGMDFAESSGRLLMLEESQPERTAPPYRMTLFVGWADEVERRLNTP